MVNTLNLVVTLLAFLLIISCSSEPNKDLSETTSEANHDSTAINKIVETTSIKEIKLIEDAHKKDAFLAKPAIQFDIKIQFRGKERLNAKVTTTTNSVVGLIEFSNGEKIYVNEDKVYCSEGLKDNKSVRFDAYTWTYFFLFPYKLSDPGTRWSEFGKKQLNNTTFNTQRLSFDAGIGDAPDDWYFVYSNSENNLIEYSGYIVTANKPKEEAEKHPHAIQYYDYKSVDDILLAHKWTFWEWTEEQGFTESIGSAEITNILFVEDTLQNFAIPDSFTKKD